MEEQRARFVSRSPGNKASPPNSSGGGAMSSRQGGRSQWHGMDLHTTTPSSHRRAMYISPVPIQAVTPQATTSSGGVPTSGESTRMKAEAAALSARNQVLHRRLSERKRFDSADYAMKMVRQAMETTSTDPSTPTASPPANGGAGGVAKAVGALNSPRLSPSHGRMVFVHALKGDRGFDDVEMKEDNQELGSPVAPPAAPTAVAPARGYGALSSGTNKSVSAAMSARNIMIQRKLKEKRHFDSADYQLACQGVATDAIMEDMGEPALDPGSLPFKQTPSPMTLNVHAKTSSPMNSPSASRAAALRSNQMSPSTRGGAGGFSGGRAAATSKYGSVGSKPSNDLRRNTLLRQQENFIAASEAAQSPAASPTAVSNEPAASRGGNQKYGKLIAANILFRKNLKDRQRFDSADYQMEAASKLANSSTGGGSTTQTYSNQDDEPASPVMKHQAKQMKLSGTEVSSGWSAHGNPVIAKQLHQEPVMRGGWAAHAGVSAARQAQTYTQQPNAQVRGDANDGVRLAARNVLLNRKLSEGKKMFDSGEYFAAKDLAARAGSNLNQHGGA